MLFRQQEAELDSYDTLFDDDDAVRIEIVSLSLEWMYLLYMSYMYLYVLLHTATFECASIIGLGKLSATRTDDD